MNSSVFDLAESKFKNKSIPEENEIPSKKEPSSFDIAESRLKGKPLIQDENEFDLEREIERNEAQLTSRALEGIVGLPFDLINTVGSLFGYDLSLPGSEKLKEFSEAATMGYTSPRNEFEKEIGDVFQDVALMALPGAKHYSLARNIGIPVVANLAKEGVKGIGAGEGSQTAAKIGTNIVLDILSHRKGLGTAKEFSGGLFDKADKLVPNGLSVNASSFKNSLNNLKESFLKGGKRPDTGESIEKIDELLGLIKENGKVNLKDALAFRQSINKWIDKFKGFEVQGIDDANRRRIINNLNDVKREVINFGEEYGKKFNPEYLKMSRDANSSWAAYSQSNKIVNFVEKTASSKIKSNGLKALLGLSLTGGVAGSTALAGLAAGAGGAAAAGLGYKLFKTILRAKNPTLRKHYFNILEGAAKGNASQVIKNIKPLDKAMEDMEDSGFLISDE